MLQELARTYLKAYKKKAAGPAPQQSPSPEASKVAAQGEWVKDLARKYSPPPFLSAAP